MSLALFALACGDTPPSPSPPATQAPAPAVPVSAVGHCADSERVVFSCPTAGGKVLSVCAAADVLQYRYGPLGAPELVYPPAPGSNEFSMGEVRYIRAEGMVLRFENQGVRYEVTSMLGAGGTPEAGAANNFQGVYVTHPSGKVTGISCMDPVEDHLDAISGSLRALDR